MYQPHSESIIVYTTHLQHPLSGILLYENYTDE